MNDDEKLKAKEGYLRRNLDAVLGNLGFHGRPVAACPNDALGCQYESPERRLLVETRFCGVAGSVLARGLVADAILHLQSHLAKAPVHDRVSGLVAILLPSAKPRVVEQLEGYIERYAPKVDWFIMDVMGRYRLRLAEHQASGRFVAPLSQAPVAGGHDRARGNLFAPKFQWLMKVLLLNGLDRKFWGGSAGQPENISDLAKAAGVSQPYASKFIAAAEAADYVERLPVGFAIRQPRELLEEWVAAIRFRSKGRVMHVEPMYPVGSWNELSQAIRKVVRDQHAAADPPSKAILGGGDACQLLGLARSNVQSLLVYVDGKVENFLNAADLVQAPEEQASITIIEPSNRESIFDGHGMAEDTPVTDILQCYLDMYWFPARGREQAQFIYEKVIEPQLKRQAQDRL
ncbi:MAG: hypothetical protein NT031_04650 [Planctomycetota bacterium]|nr:hypothetical protein [Planctomycetota bacterium]